jgi:para-aminobenzoate synthetase/4-amino-4-deoxychorismate lyase
LSPFPRENVFQIKENGTKMKDWSILLATQIKDKKDFVFLETLKSDPENFRSLLFIDPVFVLQTSRIDEVEKVLKEAEDFLKKGFYAAGYVAYEAGYAFEEKLRSLVRDVTFSSPLVWFGIFEKPCICDTEKPGTENENSAYNISRIDLNITKTEYAERIERIKDYIGSGDTYQINFTWNPGFSFNGSPLALYSDLKKKQTVAYAAFIRTGDMHILSLAPELFFRRKGKKITARPMKGTMKRGRTSAEDNRNRELLQKSEKNRAENIMIVDLLRNDLGKVCHTGSVRTKSLFDVEKYETLFQMTSTIEGELKPETSYADIFRSLFPSGSVTGAPKLRSMQIIHELEKEKRGVYTGAIGYLSPHEEAVFNIAIRTAVIEKNRGKMGIGSGIVWDSKADDEYRECSLKMNFLTEPVKEFSLLETMLLHKGRYRLLDSHIRRIKESAEYFGFPFDAGKFLKVLEKNAVGLDSREKYRVRALVDKKGNFSIENMKLAEQSGEKAFIALAGQKTDSQNIFLYHKTTKREFYDTMYRKALEKGFFDLVFINEKGEVTEGCISNIFIKRKGKLITPPIECGLLDGLMRQYILSKTRNAAEDVITPDDLRNAEEIYFCNSVRGITKVELIDEIVL